MSVDRHREILRRFVVMCHTEDTQIRPKPQPPETEGEETMTLSERIRLKREARERHLSDEVTREAQATRVKEVGVGEPISADSDVSEPLGVYGRVPVYQEGE